MKCKTCRMVCQCKPLKVRYPLLCSILCNACIYTSLLPYYKLIKMSLFVRDSYKASRRSLLYLSFWLVLQQYASPSRDKRRRHAVFVSSCSMWVIIFSAITLISFSLNLYPIILLYLICPRHGKLHRV